MMFKLFFHQFKGFKMTYNMTPLYIWKFQDFNTKFSVALYILNQEALS